MPGHIFKTIGWILIATAILVPGGMTAWGMITSFGQLQSGVELDAESMQVWGDLTMRTSIFLMNAGLLGLGLLVVGHIASQRNNAETS